jgi:hypothetical protein
VAQDPSLDIELHPIGGAPLPLSQLLTLFPMAAVVLDPYTHESSWLLDTARRILTEFRDADVRVAYLVTGTDSDGAAKFLGPLADEILGLADPDRALVRSLGLDALPALVAIRQDGHLMGAAEGWDPAAWRAVIDSLVALTAWSRPEIPAAGDPAPYAGTTALG